jgi:stage V sporulation protein G
MAGSSPDEEEHPPASIVSITVVSVKPVKFGKIFALASVEIDIDGVLLVIHGVRAMRVDPIGTRIELPMFRDENGVWRRAITLPDEISGPLAEPCWTSSSSVVWPSEVLRCDVSDLVNWEVRSDAINGLTRLAAGGFRLPGPLSHRRFPLLRPPLRRRAQPIALRQRRSFVPGACPLRESRR